MALRRGNYLHFSLTSEEDGCFSYGHCIGAGGCILTPALSPAFAAVRQSASQSQPQCVLCLCWPCQSVCGSSVCANTGPILAGLRSERPLNPVCALFCRRGRAAAGSRLGASLWAAGGLVPRGLHISSPGTNSPWCCGLPGARDASRSSPTGSSPFPGTICLFSSYSNHGAWQAKGK